MKRFLAVLALLAAFVAAKPVLAEDQQPFDKAFVGLFAAYDGSVSRHVVPAISGGYAVGDTVKGFQNYATASLGVLGVKHNPFGLQTTIVTGDYAIRPVGEYVFIGFGGDAGMAANPNTANGHVSFVSLFDGKGVIGYRFGKSQKISVVAQPGFNNRTGLNLALGVTFGFKGL